MDLVSQIKEHFNLAAVVAPHTSGLSKPQQTNYGQYFNGWCPWCQNGVKQPGKPKRFYVNVEIGLCNCMHPACASLKPMDVINFYARLWNVTNQEAIKDLRAQLTRETRQDHDNV